MATETCDICRFDGTAYALADVRGTIRSAADRWRWTVEHLDAELLERRAGEAPMSLAEYVDHTAAALALHTDLLTSADEVPTGTDDGTLGPPARAQFDVALQRLTANADRLDRAIAGMRELQWERTIVLNGAPVSATATIRHCAHHVEHHLRDGGRLVAALHARDTGAAHLETGRIAGVYASSGGVPKMAIRAARVRYRGIVGDRQTSRKHHGRVWQALCLWSEEVIGGLRAEGHPIYPGAAGENITVQGIEWSSVRPGVRLALGPEVIAEVTAYAAPCSKNSAWFRDRDPRRMEHDRHPGWSRAYAAVLHDGIVCTGDVVRQLP